MPPRLPTKLVRHLNGRQWPSTLSSTFSSSARHSQQSYDPAADLLDAINPAKTRRPATESIPSRGPGSPPPDARNPDAQGYPSTRRDSRYGHRTTSTATTDTTTPQNAASAAFKTLNQRGPAPSRPAVRPTRNQSPAVSNDTPQLSREAIRARESQFQRALRPGSIYAPHDLSPVEQMKAKSARTHRAVSRQPANTRKHGQPDAIDALGINPIDCYKNFNMLADFTSEMGRIKHGRETGFRSVNHRKMAKAVRRAIGIGILPSTHKHPELFKERVEQRGQYFKTRFDVSRSGQSSMASIMSGISRKQGP